MELLVIWEEISERNLMGTDRYLVPTCKAFVRSVVLFSWLCIVCIKCMELLSFDSSAETDVVKRFSTSAKVFVLASIGT